MLKFIKRPGAGKDAKWTLSYSADIKKGEDWEFKCGWREFESKEEVEAYVKMMEEKSKAGKEVREFEYDEEVLFCE